MNSPGQEEDNSWQYFVFVPEDKWYIAKASFFFFKLDVVRDLMPQT